MCAPRNIEGKHDDYDPKVMFAGPDYAETMGLKMVDGRFFSRASRFDRDRGLPRHVVEGLTHLLHQARNFRLHGVEFLLSTVRFDLERKRAQGTGTEGCR